MHPASSQREGKPSPQDCQSPSEMPSCVTAWQCNIPRPAGLLGRHLGRGENRENSAHLGTKLNYVWQNGHQVVSGDGHDRGPTVNLAHSARVPWDS